MFYVSFIAEQPCALVCLLPSNPEAGRSIRATSLTEVPDPRL
jgi:hypothetical protein